MAIRDSDKIWFRGKNVVTALGCSNTRDDSEKHVDPDYKTRIGDLERVAIRDFLSERPSYGHDIRAWCLCLYFQLQCTRR